MKKLSIPFFIALIAQTSISAATFRVNNTTGSGAQYTTFNEALTAASDGDVIVVDGSNTSYGKITVSKNVTVKGPGYFLDLEGTIAEGTLEAKFDEVTVTAEGATLTGLHVDGSIYLKNDKITVTRCHVTAIYCSTHYSYSESAISNCVIHQNFIFSGIQGDSYSKAATYFQITNNLFSSGTNACLSNLSYATISRNTIVPRYGTACINLSNCIIENNISPTIKNGSTNTGCSFADNLFCDYSSSSPYSELSVLYSNDREIKDIDITLTTTKGAFSGDDPYILSGLPTGPVIKNIIMPESVAKGENLNITIKIGKAK